jgi:hypothetical protein
VEYLLDIFHPFQFVRLRILVAVICVKSHVFLFRGNHGRYNPIYQKNGQPEPLTFAAIDFVRGGTLRCGMNFGGSCITRVLLRCLGE